LLYVSSQMLPGANANNVLSGKIANNQFLSFNSVNPRQLLLLPVPVSSEHATMNLASVVMLC
jgi:hypothetical protein